MKRILRSIIDFEDGKLSQEALDVNFRRLQDSNIEWPSPEDERIYGYVREFYDNNLELPTASTVRDFFMRENNVEVLERIDDIKAAPAYARAQFKHLLDEQLESIRRLKMRVVLKDAAEIVTKGRVIERGKEKVKLETAQHAWDFVMERGVAALPPPTGERTKGPLDPEEERARYKAVKGSDDKYGVLTGFNSVDRVCKGIKRGELWVHAGFTGDFKSTIAMQWSYNAITHYKTNVVYVSMEMPRKQLQRRLCTLHSSHLRWRAEFDPLDGCRVRDGELSADEERFYDTVLDDLRDNPGYTRCHIWQAESPTVEAIRAELTRMHRDFEVGLVIIDHTELLGFPRGAKDFGVEVNKIIKALKQLALSFDGGKGIPVVLLHQINREGRKSAEKANGKYSLVNLSFAHEAERSADVVTTSYSSEEMRAEKVVELACRKNRDNPMFAPVRLNVDPRCLRIWEPFTPQAAREADCELDPEVEASMEGL